MTLHPSELRNYLQRHPALILDQDFTEARCYALIVACAFIFSMIAPIFDILTVKNSTLYLCATILGSPRTLSSLFALCAVCMVPQLLTLTFLHKLRKCRLPRKLAAAASVLAAVLWGLLGTVARPLDFGSVYWLYWASAAGYLVVGGVFAFSLNTQLLNETQSTPR